MSQLCSKQQKGSNQMGDGDEVVLVGFWTSPYVMRVKIALAEKESITSIWKKNIFSKKTRALCFSKSTQCIRKFLSSFITTSPYVNPSSFFNTLLTFGVITNLLYFQRILIVDLKQDFGSTFFDNKIADCGRRMWASKGADQEAAKNEFVEVLKLLEGELGEMPYFEGDRFGLLDVALVPFACRFYTYEMFCNFSVEKECPKIMQWVKRCSLRESVSKTLPDKYKVYDFVLEVKKMLGIN